ncbi:uncharacterized protein LOC113350834 [Papaver somniferum]|uniref:uncharacterized protein LOC113350834 n=1 Tax=Papaver somniferum TaxID=3469 RepID=UPI000E6FC16D|nr:uncharacterized protein LOC113350834 [Papaver somniferum]
MVMVICWLLGNGCLLAWNSMLTMQDYYEYLFLVNSKKGKPLKGSCAAPANGGPLEVKHKKTKLTNPNPFRLSTDMNQVQSELRLARNLIAEKDLEVQRIYTTNSQYIKENERLRAIMGVWSERAAKVRLLIVIREQSSNIRFGLDRRPNLIWVLLFDQILIDGPSHYAYPLHQIFEFSRPLWTLLAAARFIVYIWGYDE